MALTKISSNLVADDAIVTGKIADGGVATADLAANAVTTAKIAQNNVTAHHIADGSVTTTQLGADSVTNAKIADDAISEEHLDKTIISDLTSVTAVNGDFLIIGDTSDSNNLKKAPVSSLPGSSALPLAGGTMTGNIAHASDFTLDVGGNIVLDADGGEVKFDDGGTRFANLYKSSNNFVVSSAISDGDILFKGSDDGSTITALTLDMSEGGAASFNKPMTVDGHTSSVASIFEGNGNGDTVPVQLKVKANNGTTSTQGLYGNAGSASTDNTIALGGSGTSGVIVDNGGKVGINTTPDTLLNLKDTGGIEVRLEADSNNNGQEDCFIRFYTDGKTQEGIAGMDNNNSSTLFSGNTENAMVFGTVSNLPVVLATNNTERVLIDNTGRVGINRTPAVANSKLEVGGADNVPLINVEASGNTAGIGIGSSEMKFFHGTTKRMGITTAGGLNVGNTTGASAGGIQTYVGDNDEAIDCEGPARVNFTINSDESGGNRWYFRTAGSGNFGSGNGDLLVLKEDGTQIMKWDLSSMTIVGNFDDTSDVALKENITDLIDATAKIKALQPRTFDWKDKNKTQGTNGFIAQEVETVLPKLVHGDNYDPENPHHGHKAINTSGLLAVAIKAIQELEARVKELEG